MSVPSPENPPRASEPTPLKLVTPETSLVARVPSSDRPGGPASDPDEERHSVLAGLIKTMRPHQWVKNLFVLAPMFFAKDVVTLTPGGDPALNLLLTGRALAATGIFCLLAGAVYTINDLVDVEADRVHPVKRFRPIASGIVPEPLARAAAGALVVTSLGLGYLLSPGFALVAAAYFAENLLYSFKLKKVAFVDVSMI